VKIRVNSLIILSLFITALSLLLTGCASVPEASPEMKQKAFSFAPSPGKAGVFLIRRNGMVGGAVLWNYWIDNQNCGSVQSDSSLYCEVPPGEHFSAASNVGAAPTKPFVFMAEADKDIFLTYGAVSAKFTQFSEEEGEAVVQKIKLSGDSHYKPPFLPETADSATPAACRIVLPQDDPFIASKVTQPDALLPIVNVDNSLAGLGAAIITSFAVGIVDAAAHGVANKHRHEKALEIEAPLLGHGIGEAFRNDFQSAFATHLNASPWLHTLPLEMSTENKQVTTAEVLEHPVVQVSVIYHLSYDASALIMQARLLYFRQGQTNSTYGRFYTYYSEPVGSEKNEAAVAKWVASDQQLLHQRLNEGLSEITAMLDLDFFHRAPMDTTNHSVNISCFDALSQIPVQWRGFVHHRENSRIIFQELFQGNFFSLVPN